ncbi:MAG: A24 family peptidase [Phascolarctobacterium sp.]|uniref:prepilin peptidase n=1 Tax=Phascolarctobacterium sp. TaxID=2049039 RepID=UPI0026DCDA26|nr:A24 family peptidase [Phascolarctobacterium sp.]MDO4922001.1 A24 family peptidase [Phascolarctobacterium sp.]
MELFFTLALAVGLARHCWTDMRELLLYDSVNAYLLALGLLRTCVIGSWREAGCGLLALGAVMLLLYLLSRGGMGEGDVKLAAVLGCWLGWERGLACLLLAFAGGAVVGLVLLACGLAQGKQALPFGPFLCAAGLVCHLQGAQLVAWYWSLF